MAEYCTVISGNQIITSFSSTSVVVLSPFVCSDVCVCLLGVSSTSRLERQKVFFGKKLCLDWREKSLMKVKRAV
jgi:hypothetical protein